MLTILVQWTLCAHQNHLLQCHLVVRLYLCTFDIEDDKDPQMTQNELFCLYSLLPRSPLSCFWLSSAVMPGFSPVFPFFWHCCLCIWNFFHAWGIGMNVWTRMLWFTEFIPFAVMWSWWGLCPAPSSLGLVLSSASTTQAYFVSRFPILRQVSPLHFIGILQGVAAGIGTSNFLRAAFIVSLNSSSFGSMKNIPLNCLALSIFGFSTAHFLFCFLFHCIRHMLPHIWPYIIWTRSWLFPRKSPPAPGVAVRWPFIQKKNIVKPVNASDNSLSPSTHVPVIFHMFLQQYVEWWKCRSGNVDAP